MSEFKRFDYDRFQDAVVEYPDGKYVLYSDFNEAWESGKSYNDEKIATLTATIAQQQADLRVLSEAITKSHHYAKTFDKPCACPACVIARKVMEGER